MCPLRINKCNLRNKTKLNHLLALPLLQGDFFFLGSLRTEMAAEIEVGRNVGDGICPSLTAVTRVV